MVLIALAVVEGQHKREQRRSSRRAMNKYRFAEIAPVSPFANSRDLVFTCKHPHQACAISKDKRPAVFDSASCQSTSPVLVLLAPVRQPSTTGNTSTLQLRFQLSLQLLNAIKPERRLFVPRVSPASISPLPSSKPRSLLPLQATSQVYATSARA